MPAPGKAKKRNDDGDETGNGDGPSSLVGVEDRGRRSARAPTAIDSPAASSPRSSTPPAGGDAASKKRTHEPRPVQEVDEAAGVGKSASPWDPFADVVGGNDERPAIPKGKAPAKKPASPARKAPTPIRTPTPTPTPAPTLLQPPLHMLARVTRPLQDLVHVTAPPPPPQDNAQEEEAEDPTAAEDEIEVDRDDPEYTRQQEIVKRMAVLAAGIQAPAQGGSRARAGAGAGVGVGAGVGNGGGGNPRPALPAPKYSLISLVRTLPGGKRTQIRWEKANYASEPAATANNDHFEAIVIDHGEFIQPGHSSISHSISGVSFAWKERIAVNKQIFDYYYNPGVVDNWGICVNNNTGNACIVSAEMRVPAGWETYQHGLPLFSKDKLGLAAIPTNNQPYTVIAQLNQQHAAQSWELDHAAGAGTFKINVAFSPSNPRILVVGYTYTGKITPLHPTAPHASNAFGTQGVHVLSDFGRLITGVVGMRRNAEGVVFERAKHVTYVAPPVSSDLVNEYVYEANGADGEIYRVTINDTPNYVEIVYRGVAYNLWRTGGDSTDEHYRAPPFKEADSTIVTTNLVLVIHSNAFERGRDYESRLPRIMHVILSLR